MQVYAKVQTGELGGETSATQMPDISCRQVAFVACAGNSGNVYIGVAGVTKKDGTTDVTTGYELDAGAQTPWLQIPNLNLLYFICDNDADDFTYIALG